MAYLTESEIRGLLLRLLFITCVFEDLENGLLDALFCVAFPRQFLIGNSVTDSLRCPSIAEVGGSRVARLRQFRVDALLHRILKLSLEFRGVFIKSLIERGMTSLSPFWNRF